VGGGREGATHRPVEGSGLASSTATKLLDQEAGTGQMLEVTERHGAVDLKHERDVVDGDGTAVREKRHQDGAAGRILDRAQELVEVGTGHTGHAP
jgi:hypothetical protein